MCLDVYAFMAVYVLMALFGFICVWLCMCIAVYVWLCMYGSVCVAVYVYCCVRPSMYVYKECLKE